MDGNPRLLIGPVLRFVGRTDATVWVETDEPCEVEILGVRERTWSVEGHHYAIVVVDGLQPGSATEYDVRLDGEAAWPDPRSDRPASRIRTLADDRPLRLVYGSCRYGRGAVKLADKHFDPDSLAAYARLLTTAADEQWPDAMLMLGDQVYADETSEATQRRIRARRDVSQGAGLELADFEEYTWIYLESWTDPDVRWLMSTVPSSMIFDDHDVRDDWNTSHEWRTDMQGTDWWQERVVGGLSSYWVYQHLGNLSPAELRENDLYRQVRTSDGAASTAALREFAARADSEADGHKGARWSFRRDFGRTRLLMIDSRCGRILADGRRSMVDEDEFAWIEQQLGDTPDADGGDGDSGYDHLLIGTSLPWLLARALHDIEAWNEALCDGGRGGRVARWSEKLRRGADLEHWASFHDSFERLGTMIESVAAGRRGSAPATVCVLSGDVHHAYIAEATFSTSVTSRIYQLTCSPLHNYVPAYMKVTFRVAWSRFAERFTRVLLGLVLRVPRTSVRWRRLAGPYFGSEIAELVISGRRAETVLRRSAAPGDEGELVEVDRRTLAA
ncbi:PhoD-like phosphatase [Jatrophihabitans endophyticus]|uniref:PhoD-like phosphatase n=1 Tax=Jatrophihabitans endophyticus TaxID=1206085 RepID=A0A1M5MT41_9ACTN|nr:alkaline phosphatase D family protein [Jatrophihabitans endophyticus]SHG80272.1 PhoD-like phosphatase [Jatrophihabitans endophyticus]